ncbi:MAG: recombination regulator RecX, partial [Gammaproteobacteria bacterium]|nr:recombination regulator RecX [Gammaproteobacteria bacterium]
AEDGHEAGNAEENLDPRQTHAAVRDNALRLLSRREHSVRELRQKLIAREYEAALVDEVLEQLQGDGSLSEERFAEAYVRQRCGRGYGPIRIRQELRERGLDAELVSAALAAVETPWRTLAETARRKKFGEEPPEDFEARARQMRFLNYRGFDENQIRAALGGRD